jgi:hypothetical protein
MATGRRPFTGEEPGLTQTGTTTRVQEAHLRLPPPEPRSLNPQLPPQASHVIMRALAKEPSARWPDVASLRAAWEAAVGATPTTDDATLIPAPPQRPPRRQPTRPRLWALLGIGLVALLAAGGALSALNRSAKSTSWTPPPLASPGLTAVPTATAEPETPAQAVAMTPTPATDAATSTARPAPASITPQPTATILPPSPTLVPTHTLPPSPTLVPTHTLPPSATPSPTAQPTPTLTPTATPTARPAPTWTPTATPTPFSAPPDCPIASAAAFRPLWLTGWQQVGCPVNDMAASDAATQRFEHGRMIWRKSNDMIYVLYEAGDWAAYPDESVDGAAEPDGPQPPAGLFAPVRGFGTTWRNRLGGATARLGWGTEAEYGVALPFQDFDHGLMFELAGKHYQLGEDHGQKVWVAP